MNKLHRSALRCLNNPLRIELASKMAQSCLLLSVLVLKWRVRVPASLYLNEERNL